MRRVLNTAVTVLSIICMIVTMGLIIFADVILKDNTVYTFITTTTESINISFETDPLVLDGTNLSLMQGVTAISESGDDVTALVDAMVVNENNGKVVMYSVNDSRYALESFKRGLELKNYKGPSITVKSLGRNSNYTCDINEIEDYIFDMIDAGYIIAKDGYGNDISQNIYISPDVNITKAGKQKIKLIVKNSFADSAQQEITIKITGELVDDEITIATETMTVKRGNTSSPNRESATAVNGEEGTFNVSVNEGSTDNQATESTGQVGGGHVQNNTLKPIIPQRPIVNEKPTAPIEPPTAPTEPPTTVVPTEPPTEEFPTSVEPPTATELPTATEPPSESETAIIHFADDNEREPMTVNVGDTFTYDVYLKLNVPEVQGLAMWTYFNQPVGTKQEANQAGNITVTEENKVLEIAEGGYTPYYSPFRENYDLMKSDSYLIGFGTGALDENSEYLMIETNNGSFTQQGGCMISTITFTVQKAGEVEIFTRVDDAVVDLENNENHAEYVAIYNQRVTDDTSTVTPIIPEEPSEGATAIIHFADDNEREPITVKVGDTFTYDIYLELTSPEVQSYVTWTYFNQPVGTKQAINQAGNIEINRENQVLKVGKGGYTPYYSPYRENYDIMKFSNYLIGFGTGSLNEFGQYQMLKTDNGLFTQKGGCLVSTITFTVQRAGEVEVFTRLDSSVVDYSTGECSGYIAIYNNVEYINDYSECEDGSSVITLSGFTRMKEQILSSNIVKNSNYIQKSYDVNQDGKYTLSDVIMISRDIFGTESNVS